MPHGRHVLFVPQVEVGVVLAGVDAEVLGEGVGEPRRTDVEHLGSVLGERAGAARAGEHVREVEHTNAVQRRVSVVPEGNRVAVGELDDLDRRCPGECLALGMGEPLLTRERTAGRETGVRQRLFEILRVPLGDLAGEGLLVVPAVEEVEVPVEQLLVRRPGLEHDVAAVAGREDTVDLDVLGSDVAGVAGLLDVVGRVQVVQRVDDVDRDVGACAAAGFPDRGARGADEQLRGGRTPHRDGAASG